MCEEIRDACSPQRLHAVGKRALNLSTNCPCCASCADVVSAEPDYKVFVNDFTPDDPRFPEQWHLPKISAPQAWDVSMGAPEVRRCFCGGRGGGCSMVCGVGTGVADVGAQHHRSSWGALKFPRGDKQTECAAAGQSLRCRQWGAHGPPRLGGQHYQGVRGPSLTKPPPPGCSASGLLHSGQR